MFDITNITKYLTIIAYIGFLVSSISGFIEVTKEFNLCEMMISIIMLINIPLIIFFELTNTLEDYVSKANYFRGYILIISSLLILGLSPVGAGIGVYSMLIGCINLFIGIFCVDGPIQLNNTNNTNNASTGINNVTNGNNGNNSDNSSDNSVY